MRLFRAIVIFLFFTFSVTTAYLAGIGTYWTFENSFDIPLELYNPPAQPVDEEEMEEFGVFWEAWHIIEREFYGKKPTEQKMTYSAIRGVIEELEDPYTTFNEPPQRELEKDEFRGEFGGIGVTITFDNDKLRVVEIFEDSPAARAGLLVDDAIIRVDEHIITTTTNFNEAVTWIRGPVGESVHLIVERAENTAPLEFDVVREKIEKPTVYKEMATENIGYIRITLFGDPTASDFRTAIKWIKQQGATALILDLRNNPGGLLNGAVDIASQFLTEGNVLIERKSSGEEKVYEVRRGGLATDLPLIILTNGGTASASEIIVGAIKDYERGLIVGEKTFGKGSVQLIYDLSDNSSMHVTVAHWFTPHMSKINEIGIEPDVEIVPTEENIAQGIDTQLKWAIENLTERIAENQ